MTLINKLSGRQIAASSLSGAALLGTGAAGSVDAGLLACGAPAVRIRPTQAPVAAAEVSANAVATKGADRQQTWIDGGFAFGETSAAEYHTMRAFRGLEPWRDPA